MEIVDTGILISVVLDVIKADRIEHGDDVSYLFFIQGELDPPLTSFTNAKACSHCYHECTLADDCVTSHSLCSSFKGHLYLNTCMIAKQTL